jgi:hypothetical protein
MRVCEHLLDLVQVGPARRCSDAKTCRVYAASRALLSSAGGAGVADEDLRDGRRREPQGLAHRRTGVSPAIIAMHAQEVEEERRERGVDQHDALRRASAPAHVEGRLSGSRSSQSKPRSLLVPEAAYANSASMSQSRSRLPADPRPAARRRRRRLRLGESGAGDQAERDPTAGFALELAGTALISPRRAAGLVRIGLEYGEACMSVSASSAGT